MSKSKGNMVRATPIAGLGADALRYYLLREWCSARTAIQLRAGPAL
jgi:methionyl-tRNA synthetase